MVNPTQKPLPIPQGGCEKYRIGQLHQESVLVFIHEKTIEEILDYSARDLRNEIGGFLVGGFYKDDQPYVEIEHFVPAFDTSSNAASLTFTHDTWSQINYDIRTEHPDSRILGWHHTHPGLGIFLSEYDLFIQRNFFSEPWQVAMVVDPRNQEFAFFQWKDEDVVDCGFICIPKS